MNRLFLFGVLVSLTLIATSSRGLAQVATAAGGDAGEAAGRSATLAEQRYALFAKQAGELELAVMGSDKPLTLREQPLQTFSSEGHTFGSVLLWKAPDGRPAVTPACELSRGRASVYTSSPSRGRVEAEERGCAEGMRRSAKCLSVRGNRVLTRPIVCSAVEKEHKGSVGFLVGAVPDFLSVDMAMHLL